MMQVDVIVPAYNAAHFLPGAIESVLAQTEPVWRILVVDDGSTDNTRTVLQPFQQALGPRLVVHHQENRGLPAARNAAIRHGSAPFLALLDADDRWLPDRLARSLTSFDGRPDVALSYSGVRLIDDHGRSLGDFTRSDVAPGVEMARRLYTRAVSLPCPTVTFRRDALAHTGLFDETLRASEDRDLWIRLAQRSEVVFIPEVLALYRSAPGSMSGDLPRMLAAQLRVLEKHAGSPGCGWLARRQALAGIHRDQALGYAARLQKAATLRHAVQAVAGTPWSIPNLRAAASAVARVLRRT